MGYPSDQELEKWILELEQEELYAPKHLKEEILKMTRELATTSEFAKNAELENAKNLEAHMISKKKSPQVTFFAYTVKVVAGMAAAILLTFVLPTGNGLEISRAEERMERMEEKADKRQEQLIANERRPEAAGEGRDNLKTDLFSLINNKRELLFEKADRVKELGGFWNKFFEESEFFGNNN